MYHKKIQKIERTTKLLEPTVVSILCKIFLVHFKPNPPMLLLFYLYLFLFENLWLGWSGWKKQIAWKKLKDLKFCKAKGLTCQFNPSPNSHVIIIIWFYSYPLYYASCLRIPGFLLMRLIICEDCTAFNPVANKA